MLSRSSTTCGTRWCASASSSGSACGGWRVRRGCGRATAGRAAKLRVQRTPAGCGVYVGCCRRSAASRLLRSPTRASSSASALSSACASCGMVGPAGAAGACQPAAPPAGGGAKRSLSDAVAGGSAPIAAGGPRKMREIRARRTFCSLLAPYGGRRAAAAARVAVGRIRQDAGGRHCERGALRAPPRRPPPGQPFERARAAARRAAGSGQHLGQPGRIPQVRVGSRRFHGRSARKQAGARNALTRSCRPRASPCAAASCAATCQSRT